MGVRMIVLETLDSAIPLWVPFRREENPAEWMFKALGTEEEDQQHCRRHYLQSPLFSENQEKLAALGQPMEGLVRLSFSRCTCFQTSARGPQVDPDGAQLVDG